MRGFGLLLAALGVCWPEFAAACAVCGAGEEESRSAFIWTTVMLSVLPPAMVGGVIWWLVRLHRQREEIGRPLGKRPAAISIKS